MDIGLETGRIFNAADGTYKVILTLPRLLNNSNEHVNLEVEFAMFAAKQKTMTAVLQMDLSKSRIFDLDDVDEDALSAHDKRCVEYARKAITEGNPPWRCVFVYPKFNGGNLQQFLWKNKFNRTIRLSAALQFISTIQQYEKHYYIPTNLFMLLWEPCGATMQVVINGKKVTIKTGGYRFYFGDYSMVFRAGSKRNKSALGIVTNLICPQDEPESITPAPIRIQPYSKFRSSIKAPIGKYLDILNPHLDTNQRIRYHEWLTSFFKWNEYLEKSGLLNSVAHELKRGELTKAQATRIIQPHKDFSAVESATAMVKAVQGTSELLTYLLSL